MTTRGVDGFTGAKRVSTLDGAEVQPEELRVTVKVYIPMGRFVKV
jgi:hypothetical protein